MTIDDRIRDEKLQYDINREVANISASSSGKTDQYEYLTAEQRKKLSSDQRKFFAKTKFAYSNLGKAFEKQTKTIESPGEKQIKTIEDNKKQLANQKN